MATVLGLSEADTESDIDAGANEQQLKHEVVDCLNEELPIGSALGRVLPIGAEVLHSGVKVVRGQALLKIRSEIVYKSIHTYYENRKLHLVSCRMISVWCPEADMIRSARTSQPRLVVRSSVSLNKRTS